MNSDFEADERSAVPSDGPQTPTRQRRTCQCAGTSTTVNVQRSLNRDGEPAPREFLWTYHLLFSRRSSSRLCPTFPQTRLPLGFLKRRFHLNCLLQHPGTNNLLAELLFIIFKLALDETSRSLDLEWYDFDALSPHLFPFAVAAVCWLLRDIVSLVPTIGSVSWFSSTHRSLRQRLPQFLWSHDLPLDINVTRRVFDCPCDDQHERTRVASIIKTFVSLCNGR